MLRKKDKHETTSIICRNRGGFTLIEMAIVLTIIGLVIGGILATVKPILFQARLTSTEANMNHIINVISAYAQRNNRLPCPGNPDRSDTAQPYGAETGSGTAGDEVGDACATGGAAEGIVPFRTLGLNPEDVRDGWGNFITYRVSPVFARDPSNAALNTHDRCRTDGIWVSAGVSRNPEKARFCCPDTALPPATDIAVSDEDGIDLWPFTRDTTGGRYADVNTPVPGSTIFDVKDDNITAIAFILISHGQNGYGAFLADGTAIAAGGTVGVGETRNQDRDESFFISPVSYANTTRHFDDVVMWRTQDQIFAETGTGSCSLP